MRQYMTIAYWFLMNPDAKAVIVQGPAGPSYIVKRGAPRDDSKVSLLGVIE